MAYGMQLRDSAGSITYDTSSQGGVFVEMNTIPVRTTNTEYNIEYSQLPGSNLYVIPVQTGDHIYKLYGPLDIVPGYTSALGYPVIRYKQVSTLATYGFEYASPTTLMVFAL